MIIIPGQSGTYRHSHGRVTALLADTGRRPPSASMARPIRAAGLWNPKAMRVMTLILVFTDSIRPLLSPWSRVAWMLGRWLRIFLASWVNSGMRQRAAQDIQRARAY